MVIPETWRDRLKLLTFLTLCAIMVGVKCGQREKPNLLVADAISRKLGASKVLHPSGRRTSSKNVRSSVGRPDDREEPGWVILPAPRDEPLWNKRTGDIHLERFGLSLAPGIQVLAPRALGMDFRIAHAKSFGLQIGAAYFFDDRKIGETLTLGYNLHKIRMLSNIDLIAGGSYTRRTALLGIRIELGQK